MSNKLGANYESTGPWCWIKSDLDEGEMVTWMILTGKGWELFCYMVAANLYILAKIQMYFRVRLKYYNAIVECRANSQQSTTPQNILQHLRFIKDKMFRGPSHPM